MVAWDPTSSTSVMILTSTKQKTDIMVVARNKDYRNLNPSTSKDTNQLLGSPSSTLDPTPNVVPNKLTIKPPKGIIHKSVFNNCARDTQKYNIFEDLAKSPSAMSAFKAL